jgi:glyoxylase-like metal-dependent hydrolase (beta-lactamase superfamily II)
MSKEEPLIATIVNNRIIHVDKLILGPWETNAYIVVCRRTGESLVIDAPARASEIIDSLNETRPRYVLLTHDHYDHTGVIVSIRKRLKVPLATHEASSYQLKTPPDIYLNDGDSLTLGKLKVDILHTPGHTPGSLCFRIGRYLFAGDTIFPGGPGHTDTPDDFREIIKSITGKILFLPDNTLILPGHGDATTVKKAREEYAAFASRPHHTDLCGDVLWFSG